MLPLSGRLILLTASIISLMWASSSKISRRLPLSILAVIQSMPFTMIVIAFIANWDSLDLVSRLGGDDLPLLYRISAVWGGRSGPLLMWCTWLAMGSLVLSKTSPNGQNSLRMVVGLNGILLSISVLLDPFAPSSGFNNYLNPLLQTDLMVIHPPIIFAFYTLCLIPAIISVSGLLEDRDEISLHDEILPWARAAFVVGTAGIGLGGLWAYTVLDWGGYWAWDPVETASFLPWVCLIAVLHARSQASVKARKASPAVMIGVGALAMHSTLVTRANGVWSSVHSFAADGAGSESSDPYLRIISLASEGAAGVEVITYLIIIV
ncbi:MAG: cytochrome c biogenesis protein CcsA, partial [Candidatus Thermoplasmatota archaeon]|nr:cytochrome c biogenesis protein CcsA [Candidatus Thermoplasmatota archaeon]